MTNHRGGDAGKKSALLVELYAAAIGFPEWRPQK
jgi:hypothetical protein